ncbi:uncharacterized protein A1O5_12600 [Cladophialophora psammophila CBS 110553]|uniref:Xylanolytic transcriptional activator regulatory domain-containing protein n=1 Tax=Cladophialophora psammophila CBS 110553 TaxID=1182543 RepID=W9VLF8_9EURO|nr:uncharacterized protein A1O5_12600 [Cladophialophora psammophila CBS 110553]EXJ56333.1 hypothetical protein A1O5_12600 [Cladophialophora psammophila CBS 110553]
MAMQMDLALDDGLLQPDFRQSNQPIFADRGDHQSTLGEAVSLPPNGRNPEDEGENNATFAEALSANSPFNNERPFHVGDPQGLVHAVMEICTDQPPTPGTMGTTQKITPQPKKTWQTNDLMYLQSKGVFSLPTADVCNSLVRDYFEHVHPLVPIIDAGLFLSQYAHNGASSMNLLLLWSVFLAAANFASPEVLQSTGYPSRKALKRAMYTRAKALYDSDYEDDKVCVVQSVTLMGFWYSDLEDRTGPWHWMGIAIGLCQIMGLHRTPRLAPAASTTRLRQRLFRRIWWCCFMRDRWLSLGLGRPMRIDLEDCDVPMPEAEDITKELEQLPAGIAKKYMPAAIQEDAVIWVHLIKLSVSLGKILRKLYGKSAPNSESDDFQAYEAELEGCRLAKELETGNSYQPELLSKVQFEMLFEFVSTNTPQSFCVGFSLRFPGLLSLYYIDRG